MRRHKQVWVKVNAIVDEGIAPIVEALSEFAGVYTATSCQGYAKGKEEGSGSVVFAYAPNDPRKARYYDGPLARDAAIFAIQIGQALWQAVQDDAELSVSYSHRPPLLTLRVRQSAIKGVAAALRDLAKQLN